MHDVPFSLMRFHGLGGDDNLYKFSKHQSRHGCIYSSPVYLQVEAKNGHQLDETETNVFPSV